MNVDCDHYINNSKSLREAEVDPQPGKKIRWDLYTRHIHISQCCSLRRNAHFDLQKNYNLKHLKVESTD
ncbi:hypothetical protein YC2023_083668 [Brassica napus]